MAFPTNVLDLSGIANGVITEMVNIKRTCTNLSTFSAGNALDIGRLNESFRALQSSQATLDQLAAKVQVSDHQTLRNWAAANLRMVGGTAYSGDFVTDYGDARSALDATVTWLRAQFPLAVNVTIQASQPFDDIAPVPWQPNDAAAVALRAQLQMVINAIG